MGLQLAIKPSVVPHDPVCKSGTHCCLCIKLHNLSKPQSTDCYSRLILKKLQKQQSHSLKCPQCIQQGTVKCLCNSCPLWFSEWGITGARQTISQLGRGEKEESRELGRRRRHLQQPPDGTQFPVQR